MLRCVLVKAFISTLFAQFVRICFGFNRFEKNAFPTDTRTNMLVQIRSVNGRIKKFESLPLFIPSSDTERFENDNQQYL